MFHFKLKSFTQLVFASMLLVSTAHAAAPVRKARRPASDDTPAATADAKPGQTVAKPKPRANRALTRLEIGVSYVIWNERFSITKAGATSFGNSSYGGYAVNFERTWIRHRWQWGGDLAFGIGKASAGNLNGALPEGRDRPWYAVSLAPYVNYRVSVNGQFGLGAMVRYRNVAWVALDTATQINVSQEIQIAPLLDIRWGFGKWNFIQTFAMLDSVGDSLWMWTIQRAF